MIGPLWNRGHDYLQSSEASTDCGRALELLVFPSMLYSGDSRTQTTNQENRLRKS